MYYIAKICEGFTDYGAMLFLVGSMLCWKMEKRSRFFVRYTAAAALYIGLTHHSFSIPVLLGFERFGQWPLFTLGAYLNLAFVVIFLLEVLALWFCFRGYFFTVLFLNSAAYAIQHLCSSVNTFIRLAFGITGLNYDGGAFGTILYFVIDACIIAVIFLIYRRKRGNAFYPKNPAIVGLSVITVAIVSILSIVVTNSGLANAATSIYAAAACVLILIIIFLSMGKSSAERRQEAMEVLLREKDAQYQISREAMDLINIRCHDLKKQIGEIRRREPARDWTEVCDEVEHAIKVFGAVHDTGCEALDVILNEKSLACLNDEIQLTCSISDARPLSSMNAVDLYAIFGNLLDNAIEAVRREEKPNRIVKLNIKQSGRMLFIWTENTCSRTPAFQNGLPVTTKEEKLHHGFGLQSVHYVVEKYGGNLTLGCEDHVFMVRLWLPLPDPD